MTEKQTRSTIRLSDEQLAEAVKLNPEDVPRPLAESADNENSIKRTGHLPREASFVAALEFYFQIDWFDAVIWFNRTTTHDELWTATSLLERSPENPAGVPNSKIHEFVEENTFNADCVIRVRRQYSVEYSVVELFARWLRYSSYGYTGYNHFFAGGLVSRRLFARILRHVRASCEEEQLQREENKRIARMNESEIIHVARELNLCPEPAGHGTVQWYANCPGTNHRLMITTSDDVFGCGYCRRKGGPDELREFVGARRQKAG